MSLKSLFIISLTVILLSGCGAKYDVSRYLTLRDIEHYPQNEGHVIFSDFDVPQSVDRIYIAHNHIPNRMPVSIYDVTEEVKYIGNIDVNPPSYNNQKINYFAEVSLPIGKRTLMLVENTILGLDKIRGSDFIEINVTKDNIIHIAISSYPSQKEFIRNNWYTRPKFTKLVGMDNKSFDYCSQNICLKCESNFNKNKDENITQFLQQGSIDSQQKYLATYCLALADENKIVTTLNQKSHEEFEKVRAEIQEVKNRDFPEWQISNDKNRVFRLIQFKYPAMYYPPQKVMDGNKSYQLF